MKNIIFSILQFLKQIFGKPYVQIALAQLIMSVYQYITSKIVRYKPKTINKKTDSTSER